MHIYVYTVCLFRENEREEKHAQGISNYPVITYNGV